MWTAIEYVVPTLAPVLGFLYERFAGVHSIILLRVTDEYEECHCNLYLDGGIVNCDNNYEKNIITPHYMWINQVNEPYIQYVEYEYEGVRISAARLRSSATGMYDYPYLMPCDPTANAALPVTFCIRHRSWLSECLVYH